MEQDVLDKMRYPIGRFTPPAKIDDEIRMAWIQTLEEFPEKLRESIDNLTDEQLDTPYRPGGWTVRQVVHHLSDSHHNSYIRFKWALTEDVPVIKVYDEKAWASLFDSQSAPVEMSLRHLEAIHAKLVYLLRGLEPAQYSRGFQHPEAEQPTTLEENIGRYAWHGAHHLQHILNLIARQGW